MVSTVKSVVTMQIGAVRFGRVRFRSSAERDASPFVAERSGTGSSHSASGGYATFWTAVVSDESRCYFNIKL